MYVSSLACAYKLGPIDRSFIWRPLMYTFEMHSAPCTMGYSSLYISMI